VRVGVGRFVDLLFGRQFVPVFELIVTIARAFGEHRTEEVDVGAHAAEASVEPRREALRQEPRRGMLRGVHVAGKGVEGVPVHFGRARADVKHVVAIPWSQGE